MAKDLNNQEHLTMIASVAIFYFLQGAKANLHRKIAFDHKFFRNPIRIPPPTGG
jgi:hypothetical protein